MGTGLGGWGSSGGGQWGWLHSTMKALSDPELCTKMTKLVIFLLKSAVPRVTQM
jgi:hypothetical protein